jgi:hypothetical protein
MIYMHMVRKGHADVASLLNLLNDLTNEDVRAVVDATAAPSPTRNMRCPAAGCG